MSRLPLLSILRALVGSLITVSTCASAATEFELAQADFNRAKVALFSTEPSNPSYDSLRAVYVAARMRRDLTLLDAQMGTARENALGVMAYLQDLDLVRKSVPMLPYDAVPPFRDWIASSIGSVVMTSDLRADSRYARFAEINDNLEYGLWRHAHPEKPPKDGLGLTGQKVISIWDKGNEIGERVRAYATSKTALYEMLQQATAAGITVLQCSYGPVYSKFGNAYSDEFFVWSPRTPDKLVRLVSVDLGNALHKMSHIAMEACPKGENAMSAAVAGDGIRPDDQIAKTERDRLNGLTPEPDPDGRSKKCREQFVTEQRLLTPRIAKQRLEVCLRGG